MPGEQGIPISEFYALKTRVDRIQQNLGMGVSVVRGIFQPQEECCAGIRTYASRADHLHSIYATDTDLSTHANAADPHTGYRLESADHSHQSTGAQAGQIDHGAALTGLTDDDHTQYVRLAGRACGQRIQGGTAAGDNLILESSAHGTPTGAVIVNEDGHDTDFRVESDCFTHMLFVCAGNDRVGMGTSTPNTRLDISGAITALQARRTVCCCNSAVLDNSYFTVVTNCATMADGFGGRLGLRSGDACACPTTVGAIDWFRAGADNTATIALSSATGGTLTEGLRLASTETVVNESGADRNFRVEGDNQQNLIMADAGLDTVGIGVPAAANVQLQVTRSSGDVTAARGLGVTFTCNRSSVTGGIPIGLLLNFIDSSSGGSRLSAQAARMIYTRNGSGGVTAFDTIHALVPIINTCAPYRLDSLNLCGPTVAAGKTLTTWRGISIGVPGGSGSVTNVFGLSILGTDTCVGCSTATRRYKVCADGSTGYIYIHPC